MNDRDKLTIEALTKYNYQIRYDPDRWTGELKYMFAFSKGNRSLFTMLKVDNYLYEKQENFVVFIGFVETTSEKRVPIINPEYYFHSSYNDGQRLICIEVGVSSGRLSDPIDLYELREYYDYFKPYFMEEIFG